jgi:hypothetical protein
MYQTDEYTAHSNRHCLSPTLPLDARLFTGQTAILKYLYITHILSFKQVLTADS